MRSMALVAVSLAVFIRAAAGAEAVPAPGETDHGTLAAQALAALQSGEPSAAIARYEALADRGEANATYSFNRGIAYASRVRLGGEVPGDLGQAAHGFEEALTLAPSSPLAAQARTGAALIRSEVARRRARDGSSVELDTARSLREAILHLLPENAWGALAAVGSLAAALGVFLLLQSRVTRARVAGGIATAVGSVLLVACGAMATASQRERLATREAVVVTASARLANDSHLVLPQAPALPEAARVRILETSGSWSRLLWGNAEGWLPASSVRLIATDTAK